MGITKGSPSMTLPPFSSANVFPSIVLDILTRIPSDSVIFLAFSMKEDFRILFISWKSGGRIHGLGIGSSVGISIAFLEPTSVCVEGYK